MAFGNKGAGGGQQGGSMASGMAQVTVAAIWVQINVICRICLPMLNYTYMYPVLCLCTDVIYFVAACSSPLVRLVFVRMYTWCLLCPPSGFFCLAPFLSLWLWLLPLAGLLSSTQGLLKAGYGCSRKTCPPPPHEKRGIPCSVSPGRHRLARR